MEYKTANDYELVYLIRENDDGAYQYMQAKYANLISQIAKKYYKNNSYLGIEYEDLYQDGLYAFEIALSNYDTASSLFYTYVTICITREIEKTIKKAKRNKQMVLTTAYSMNSPIPYYTELTLEDVLQDSTILGTKKQNIEEQFVSSEYTRYLYYFQYELDYPKSAIYELKINNFSNGEISSLLSIKYKDVDNALRTIRKKLKIYKNKFLEE